MSKIPESEICPITGKPGRSLRTRQPEELFQAYNDYCKFPLTAELKQKYFTDPVTEYFCKASGLRWYSPCRLGESDFYERLSSFPHYYNPGSWDKLEALQILLKIGGESAVDVGCGDGWLVREAMKAGLQMMGTDLNAAAIANGKKEGLSVYHPDDIGAQGRHVDTLVSLQTLEHVHNPVAWLQAQIDQFTPNHLILAVPAHDTMLGRAMEPLCWPPHHFTQWSAQAMHSLADKIGFKVVRMTYEPNDWRRFNGILNRERRRCLDGTPTFPKGRRGALLFWLLSLLRVSWVSRAHTLLVVLKRMPT
jgi:2-polyprenyl-3-methyl-5-hydroxy-6-metoxy-1,4-benzoquinol methylase